ncbi:MAG TPA: Rrf2 family transcriptional regulator [Nitrospirota bacterium]|nr:Rrf2 family transcriptional regulator [Nitrospirota bacterium]
MGRNIDELLSNLNTNIHLSANPAEVCSAQWEEEGDKTLKPSAGLVGKVFEAMKEPMLITRETDYAIRCILYLAHYHDRIASVKEIARAMHIPKSFLAKILQRLVRNGILESIRGAQGGFRLTMKPSEISLLTIMEAIQGRAVINICAIDSKRCRMSSTCAVHPVWVDIRKEVEARLKKQSIAGLVRN